MGQARVCAEGAMVLIEVTNGTVPPEAARLIGRQLIIASLEAEKNARTDTAHALIIGSSSRTVAAGNANVGHREGRVLIEVPSGLIPRDKARAIGRALIAKAVEAEEYALANDLILDSALLIRAGVPLVLTKDPRILEEAKKEAQHNRDLRRYLPGGVKGIETREVMGVPTVSNVPGTSPAEIAAAKAGNGKAA